MANFNTHFNVAFAASGIAGLFLYKVGLITTGLYLSCVLAGTLGGLLPDIDSESSTPVRVGFRVVSMAVAFAMVIHYTDRYSVSMLLGLWALTYITIRHGILRLYSHLTVHRGVVHSVPYMALLALLAVYSSYYLFEQNTVSSWFIGAFVLGGALIHLILDEMYSVNLLGVRLKKSFGTALKFFEWDRKFTYIILYGLVISLWGLAPSMGDFNQRMSQVDLIKYNRIWVVLNCDVPRGLKP